MTRSDPVPVEPIPVADTALGGRFAVETLIITTVTQMLAEMERDFSGPITPQTLLVGDLGCNSLDVAMLIGSVNQQLQLTDIPFEKLRFVNGRRVVDISLQTLTDFMWSLSRGSADHAPVESWPAVQTP